MGQYEGAYEVVGEQQPEDYPQEGEIEGIEEQEVEGEEEQQDGGIQFDIPRAGVKVTINQN